MLTGDLVTWLYQDLAGIRADPYRPGFAHAILAPQPIATLEWASAAYDAMTGTLESAWRRDGATISFEMSVPPNVEATVKLPGAAPFAVASGRHRFTRPA
jgi:alpha-L-rhamnosidase